MSNQFFSPEGDIENYFVTEYWLIDQWIGDKVYNWGLNDIAKLGTNDAVNRSTPVTTIAGGTNWKQVSMYQHATGVKQNGTLWVWGSGASAKLGNNDTGRRSTPITTFAGGNNWSQAWAGGNHTVALKMDGTLWTWGTGAGGRLGTNDANTRSTPVTTFTGGNNWKQCHTSTTHVAAIKTDGSLWLWGGNDSAQIGINVGVVDKSTPVTTFVGGTNWKQVSCGAQHTAAVKTDGTLWIWGYNAFCQLGINDTATRSTPVTTLVGGTNWSRVGCGQSSTSAIKNDGTLWVWGLNTSAQLGVNDTNTRSTPVTTFAGGTNWKYSSFGDIYSSAVKTDGTLWVWGTNTFAQLGINNAATRSTPVTTFAGGTNWKQSFCALETMIAVTSGSSDSNVTIL